MPIASVTLLPEQFGRGETVLARAGKLVASTFRYSSGVAGLRITNAVGEVELVPFQGQQVWRASFHGRDPTMRSLFDEPVATTDYLSTYGALFIHCGATAMGNPGAADTHPLHGELPNAPYPSAELLIGEDGDGPFMGLTGCYRHIVAFTHSYEARPVVRVHENSSILRCEIAITNRKQRPMDLMYLAHVNFRPVDGGRLVDSVADPRTGYRIRTTLPEFFRPSAEYLAYRDSIVADPALHRKFVAGRAIDPELVMAIDCKAGADGWSQAMQVHPDGSADMIRHRPSELPRGVRWIVRNPDQDALGVVLPSTAEADGYTAEKAKGNVLQLGPGETWRAHLEFGMLQPTEVAAVEQAIALARDGAR